MNNNSIETRSVRVKAYLSLVRGKSGGAGLDYIHFYCNPLSAKYRLISEKHK